MLLLIEVAMSQRSRSHRLATERRLEREHRARAEVLAEAVYGSDLEGVECANCSGEGTLTDWSVMRGRPRYALGSAPVTYLRSSLRWRTVQVCRICEGTGDAREVATLAILRGEAFDLDAATVAAERLMLARSSGLGIDRSRESPDAPGDAARGRAILDVLAGHVDHEQGPRERRDSTPVRARLSPPELPPVLRWAEDRRIARSG